MEKKWEKKNTRFFSHFARICGKSKIRRARRKEFKVPYYTFVLSEARAEKKVETGVQMFKISFVWVFILHVLWMLRSGMAFTSILWLIESETNREGVVYIVSSVGLTCFA